jgi:predicted component of type VI protein secretion system
MAFIHRFTDQGRLRRDELDDITQNLASVLNTKRQFGSLGSELGIGNYLASQGARDSVAALTAEIEKCVRLYEPRLGDIELELIGKNSELELLYQLYGVVSGRRHKLMLRFNTTYGNVRVERVQTP